MCLEVVALALLCLVDCEARIIDKPDELILLEERRFESDLATKELVGGDASRAAVNREQQLATGPQDAAELSKDCRHPSPAFQRPSSNGIVKGPG